MKIDFDQPIIRNHTASVKHDGCLANFGTSDVLPLWVADMDFAAPRAVTEALIERAHHPVYGYTFYPDSLYQAQIDWLKNRHNWNVTREQLLITPGIVPSLFAAVLAVTKPHEAVIVQPPVYPPFFSAVTHNGRRLILNPLKLAHGRYTMDFAHLEACAAQGARLLLLCSPHNPVGRIWNKLELNELLRIARQYELTIFSDEIHADLIYPGLSFIPLASLAYHTDKLITAVSPSKTFNIPGLGLSCLISSDALQLDAVQKVFASLHIINSNPFSIAAFIAAYRNGTNWLDNLLIYLGQNRDFVRDYLVRFLPKIRLIEPEGTYLLWLDCREMGLSDEALVDFFVSQARVGLNPGSTFGREGDGFMRMNIASPRSVLLTALARIRQAYHANC